jgi:hypothetical protein
MLDTLTQNLFLGTRKGKASLDAAPGCLSGLFCDIEALSATPEEKLLYRLSLGTLFNAAAFKPGLFQGRTAEPAGDDPRPSASQRAGGILGDALVQSWKPLVHEWIGLSLTAGVRPPFRVIPALLDLAGDTPAFRNTILDACGPRAIWLSGFNPGWKDLYRAASHDDNETTRLWEEGTLNQRKEVIVSLRKTHPDKARAMIRDVLPSENAATRNTLVALMETGLCRDDEDLLEHLLDEDRSLEVRRTASDLLSRIPGAALGSRMKERLSSFVSLTRGLLKKTLRVEPPEEADEAMKRDSITDKAVSGMGKQAVMLKRAVALTPLTWWKESFSMEPGQLLPLILKTDWEQALILGLSDAAMAQKDSEWITALMEAKNTGEVILDRHQLMMSLSVAERESMILKHAAVEQPHLILILLDDRDALCASFHPETSTRILKIVQSAIGYRASDYRIRDILKRLGFYLHPAILGQCLSGWPENNPNWPYYSEQAIDFLHIIKSRIDLYKELS